MSKTLLTIELSKFEVPKKSMSVQAEKCYV